MVAVNSGLLGRIDEARTAEIARENNRRPAPVELNGSRAQDVTRASKKGARSSRKVQTLLEFDGFKLFERSLASG